MAREQAWPLSRLAALLPQRFTASDRLKDFPTDLGAARIAALRQDRAAVERAFGQRLGPVVAQERTDGLRLHFARGDILHLRPSGNAPELRLYTEAGDLDRAQELIRIGMVELRSWRDG